MLEVLARKETKDETAAIETAMPPKPAAEMIVVNGNDDIRPFRMQFALTW